MQTFYLNVENGVIYAEATGHARQDGEIPANVSAFGRGFADTFRRLARAVYRDMTAVRPSPEPDYPASVQEIRRLTARRAFMRKTEEESFIKSAGGYPGAFDV